MISETFSRQRCQNFMTKKGMFLIYIADESSPFDR